MSDTIDHDDPATPGDAPRAGLPRWKKVLMFAAGALVTAGLALLPFQTGSREDLSTSAPQGMGQGQAFDAQGNPIPAGERSAAGVDDPTAVPQDGGVSPGLMKMGFSFFAAFAVGLAFRSFLKLALIFVGLQLLALFGLSYVDWVTVNWETMSRAFDTFVDRVQQEAGSFQTFITGALPQAGMGGLGLLAGFKK